MNTLNEQKTVWSHGSWMTPEEDVRACDIVDAIMQGDYD